VLLQNNKGVKGPLKWMAPELLKQSGCTDKCDIYSFAITVWEIIHEKAPWENKEPQIAARLVLKNERPEILIPKNSMLIPANTTRAVAQTENRLSVSMDIAGSSPGTSVFTDADGTRRTVISAADLEYCRSNTFLDEKTIHSLASAQDENIRKIVATKIIETCWKPDPNDRPNIYMVHDSLVTIFERMFNLDLAEYDYYKDVGHDADYQTFRASNINAID